MTEKRASPYADYIAPLAPGFDPRHVEAFIRLEYGTLDHLGPEQFRNEVAIAMACIRETGAEDSEALARSFGL